MRSAPAPPTAKARSVPSARAIRVLSCAVRSHLHRPARSSLHPSRMRRRRAFVLNIEPQHAAAHERNPRVPPSHLHAHTGRRRWPRRRGPPGPLPPPSDPPPPRISPVECVPSGAVRVHVGPPAAASPEVRRREPAGVPLLELWRGGSCRGPGSRLPRGRGGSGEEKGKIC